MAKDKPQPQGGPELAEYITYFFEHFFNYKMSDAEVDAIINYQ